MADAGDAASEGAAADPPSGAGEAAIIVHPTLGGDRAMEVFFGLKRHVVACVPSLGRELHFEQDWAPERGLIGGVIWHSSYVLAEALLAGHTAPEVPPLGPAAVRGRAVLELGSGVTALGAYAAFVAGARVAVASDFAEAVPLLRRNALRNSTALLAAAAGSSRAHSGDSGPEESAVHAQEGRRGRECPPAVPAPLSALVGAPGAGGLLCAAPLDWDDREAASAVCAAAGCPDGFDVVVGADLVYHEPSHAPLLRALRHVAAPGSLVVLASKRRHGREEEVLWEHRLPAAGFEPCGVIGDVESLVPSVSPLAMGDAADLYLSVFRRRGGR